MSARWTAAEIEILRAGIRAGDSARLVGDRVGRTREATVAQAHRLGLSFDAVQRPAGAAVARRATGLTADAAEPGAGRAQAAEPLGADVEALRAYLAAPPPEALPTPFADLPGDACGWLLHADADGPVTAATLACGAPRATAGGPYCAAHAARAFCPGASSSPAALAKLAAYATRGERRRCDAGAERPLDLVAALRSTRLGGGR